MRVLILSQFFEPEPIPKPLDLAQGLVARGHSVCVLTGFPNYPSGVLYEGYVLHLLSREIVADIPVVRSWLYPSHDRSVMGRILNYCSFMVSSVIGALFTPSCDVIYVWHPPLTIGVAAWLISMIKGAPFVYDVQDIWPESGVWSGMLKEGFLVKLLHLLERFVYARADHLLVVTEGAKRNLMGKGVPAEKISVASHWIEEGIFGAEDTERAGAVSRAHGFTERFVVMYAGNVGLVQGLETVLRAAALLRDEQSPLFVIVGEGSDKSRLQDLSAKMGLSNVLFIDRQPMSDIPHYMANAQVLLLPLKYSEICELAIPVKTFAYMAAGRPILAAIKGASADLISTAGAGLLVPPEDPQAMAAALRHFMLMSSQELRAMGESGRQYLIAHHSKERVLDDYVALLGRFAPRAGSRRWDVTRVSSSK